MAKRFALNLEANGPPGQNGLSGLVVLGSNGEFPFLTSAERIEVLRTAKLEAAKAEQVRLLLAFVRACTSVRLTTSSTAAFLCYVNRKPGTSCV